MLCGAEFTQFDLRFLVAGVETVFLRGKGLVFGIQLLEVRQCPEPVGLEIGASGLVHSKLCTVQLLELGGIPYRLKLLCLPTLYGTISHWSGMAPESVVYRLIPCLTLCMGYLAYGRLGAVLFDHNREKCNIFMIIVGILFCPGT